MDDLIVQLDQLTKEAHEIDAWCNYWIVFWLAMDRVAATADAKALYRYEVTCWSKMRSRSVQAIYAEINRLLRRANG